MPSLKLQAEPEPLAIDLDKSALVIIDMQRDFLEPGGFGAALGNDVSRLQAAVAPCREVLAASPRVGMLVIHTREGHRPYILPDLRPRTSEPVSDKPGKGAFYQTDLELMLHTRGIDSVFVGGVTT